MQFYNCTTENTVCWSCFKKKQRPNALVIVAVKYVIKIEVRTSASVKTDASRRMVSRLQKSGLKFTEIPYNLVPINTPNHAQFGCASTKNARDMKK